MKTVYVYDRTGSLLLVCDGTFRWKLGSDYWYYYAPIDESVKEKIRREHANKGY